MAPKVISERHASSNCQIPYDLGAFVRVLSRYVGVYLDTQKVENVSAPDMQKTRFGNGTYGTMTLTNVENKNNATNTAADSDVC